MERGDDIIADSTARPEREGVGAMLRSRRLELGLSQGDVAHVVKLPARRIEAMEQERWEELPDGPYLRGFLRNVARALKLDAATLMERVDASLMRSRSPESILVPQGAAHATLPRRNGPADDRRGGRALVFGAFVFALLAAVIAWSGTDSFDHLIAGAKARIEGASEPVALPANPRAEGKSDDPSDRAIDGMPARASTVNPGESDAAAGTKQVDRAAAPSTSSSALALHFNEDAWVEVRSADGTVLLKRLNAAGSEQQIDGEAPFSLIVGNAKGVALRFRGQPVDLAPYTRDQVARLTLS